MLMLYEKLSLTLMFSASDGEKYKYEIFQDIPGYDFSAVLSVRQNIETEKYGEVSAWTEIIDFMRLRSQNLSDCEQECKNHFFTNF